MATSTIPQKHGPGRTEGGDAEYRRRFRQSQRHARGAGYADTNLDESPDEQQDEPTSYPVGEPDEQVQDGKHYNEAATYGQDEAAYSDDGSRSASRGSGQGDEEGQRQSGNEQGTDTSGESSPSGGQAGFQQIDGSPAVNASPEWMERYASGSGQRQSGDERGAEASAQNNNQDGFKKTDDSTIGSNASPEWLRKYAPNSEAAKQLESEPTLREQVNQARSNQVAEGVVSEAAKREMIMAGRRALGVLLRNPWVYGAIAAVVLSVTLYFSVQIGSVAYFCYTDKGFWGDLASVGAKITGWIKCPTTDTTSTDATEQE